MITTTSSAGPGGGEAGPHGATAPGRRARVTGTFRTILARFRDLRARLSARATVAELRDLKGMTVRALRDLAARLLGPGAAKLRTRDQLVAAIGAAVAKAAGRNGAPAEPPVAGAADAGDAHAWERGAGRPAEAAEPRPEGHLVARLAGEAEAHRAPHALTEDRLSEAPDAEGIRRGPPPAEEEGELPARAGDDTFVALPRDPRTLWCFWDLAPATVARAVAGLSAPRAKLRVYAGDQVVRDQDFALESRSFYVNDLPTGGAYRAEIWFVGPEGERRVGWPAREVVLPRVGPSPVVDDRFATVPWGMPLSRRLDLFEKTVAEEGFAPETRETLFEVSEGIRLATEGGKAAWPHSEAAPSLGGGPPGAPTRPEGLMPSRPSSTWSGARYERTAYSGTRYEREE